MGHGIRTAFVGVVAIVMACGRSGLELADALEEGGGGGSGRVRGGSGPSADDDIVSGGTQTGGSSTATGGVGASQAGRGAGGRGAMPTGGTGGSGGRPEPPIDPGGPIPNCRADSPVTVAPKNTRWIYLEAKRTAAEPEGRYLLELTPDGPRNVFFVSEQGGFRGWSADGRFLAYSRSGPPYLIELLDFSQGTLPVSVAVPPRAGDLMWSRADERYAVEPDVPATATPELVVVDATTATEKVIELPPVELELTIFSWSPDDRYVALEGDGGIVLVDTSGADLELVTVYEYDAGDALWSPDGRYLAFRSLRSGDDNRRLLLFDTRSGTLDVLNDEAWYVNLDYIWAGDTRLVMTIGDESFFLDVSERPFSQVPFAELEDAAHSNGAVSPGGKCYAYEGYCEAADELGVCVKTLPPDPEKPSVLVQRADGNFWFRSWAGTGDQLLIHSPGKPYLINVELDGGDFTRRVVIEGTLTNHVETFSHWNPSGQSDWILYTATPSPGGEYTRHPRLWNREATQNFDIDIGLGDLQGTAWSKDGRYLLSESGSSLTDNVYYVQEVLDGELGQAWQLTELVAAQGSQLWPFYFQP